MRDSAVVVVTRCLLVVVVLLLGVVPANARADSSPAARGGARVIRATNVTPGSVTGRIELPYSMKNYARLARWQPEGAKVELVVEETPDPEIFGARF